MPMSSLDPIRVIGCLLFVPIWLTALPSSIAAETFDIIIRGGTVYDGSGGASYVADVGLRYPGIDMAPYRQALGNARPSSRL